MVLRQAFRSPTKDAARASVLQAKWYDICRVCRDVDRGFTLDPCNVRNGTCHSKAGKRGRTRIDQSLKQTRVVLSCFERTRANRRDPSGSTQALTRVCTRVTESFDAKLIEDPWEHKEWKRVLLFAELRPHSPPRALIHV
jgi:hypothetical protein